MKQNLHPVMKHRGELNSARLNSAGRHSSERGHADGRRMKIAGMVKPFALKLEPGRVRFGNLSGEEHRYPGIGSDEAGPFFPAHLFLRHDGFLHRDRDTGSGPVQP